MILRAIEFATKKHEGQFRRGTGQPYISHPIMVSYILARYKESDNIEDLICASILHDTLEDTDTTFEEIFSTFNATIASLVLELTNDEEKIKQVGKLVYHKQKLKGMSSWALTIKLADRLSNIMDKPSNKMIGDTIELMNFLKDNRTLTLAQMSICSDILKECYKKQKGE